MVEAELQKQKTNRENGDNLELEKKQHFYKKYTL